MTLFDIDKAIMDFEFEIDEETGEVLNAIDLDGLKMAREQKIEGVGLYIKNLEAEKEAVKREKDSMALREKRLGKKIEGLKEYLSYALQGEKFSTARVVMSYRKSESVNIPDETAIPTEWCNVSVVKKPDKAAIKAALKSGKEVFGAELVTKQNLQVR